MMFLYLYLFTFALLEWGPENRWMEGWIMPHREPKERCIVKCGTCVRYRDR